MPKEFKCLQCEKVFKKKYYRMKHIRYQHQFYQCEICKQMIKEGSRNVHMLRCKKKAELKTTRCLLCGKDFVFEEILYHLKKVHCAWNHITSIKQPEQPEQQPEQEDSDTDSEMETIHCQIVNGHIAPPPSPAQQQQQEVPEEIYELVEELKAIGAREQTEQHIERQQQQIEEERQQQQAAPEMTEDLQDINSEDLVRFDNFDFNLLLL